MPQSGNWLRRVLFKILPLKGYLKVISRLYLISFRMGLLKNSKNYEYPYFLKHIVKEGDVCLDIGANLGYYTTILSKLVGPKGQVHAVEPIKPILDVLRSNTSRSKNVTILPFALGDQNGKIKLGNDSIREKGFLATGSHFVLSSDANVDVTFEAEIRKGSELFSSLSKIDFVKCDIEGYEEIVIPEMIEVFKRNKPVVLIESGGESRKKLLTLFEALEYHSFLLDKDKLIPVAQNSTWDILFIPSQKIADFQAYIL